MAVDVAAGSVVELIFGLTAAIKDAAATAKRNRKECQETATRASVLQAALSLLDAGSAAAATRHPAVIPALERLHLAFNEALQAIRKCQDDGAVARLFKAGKRSRVLRQVNKDITRRMKDADFIVGLHTNNVIVRQNLSLVLCAASLAAKAGITCPFSSGGKSSSNTISFGILPDFLTK